MQHVTKNLPHKIRVYKEIKSLSIMDLIKAQNIRANCKK